MRICYDPYAIHFVSPGILEWAACAPDEVMAMRKERERFFPGLDSTIAAGVRFFDDFVKRFAQDGLEKPEQPRITAGGAIQVWLQRRGS